MKFYILSTSSIIANFPPILLFQTQFQYQLNAGAAFPLLVLFHLLLLFEFAILSIPCLRLSKAEGAMLTVGPLEGIPYLAVQIQFEIGVEIRVSKTAALFLLL